MAMAVFDVHYVEAVPTWGYGQRAEQMGIGWSDSHKTVLIHSDGDTDEFDAQKAVDTVKQAVLSYVDPTCPKDAPINTVRGFKLESVKLVTRVDFVVM